MWTETRSSRTRTAVPGLLAALLVLLFAALTRETIILSVGLAALSLYATACIWVEHVARRVEVTRSVPDHVFQGEEVRVEVRIRNGSRLPIPWLRFSDEVVRSLGATSAPSALMHLAGRGEHVCEYTICPCGRGAHNIGPLSVQLGDLLGVQDQRISIPESEPIIVYPRIVPLQRLGLPTHSTVAAVSSPLSVVEDASRVIGVRDYQHGDSLRRMHWAASAQLGRPLVKQFQPAVGRPTLLCLDLHRDRYPLYRWHAIEQAIVVAASLAYHIILREGQAVGLVTQKASSSRSEQILTLLPASSHGHLLGMLDQLAQLNGFGAEGLVGAMRATIARLPVGSSVVCIGGRVSHGLVEAMFEARRHGHTVSFVTVATGDGNTPSPSIAGIPVYCVLRDQDMEAL